MSAPFLYKSAGCMQLFAFFMLNRLMLVKSYIKGTLGMLALIMRTLKTRRLRFTCKRKAQPTNAKSHAVATRSFIYTHSSTVLGLTHPHPTPQRRAGICFSFVAWSYLNLQLSRAFSSQQSRCGLRHVRASYLRALFTAATRAKADSSGGKEHQFIVVSVVRRRLRDTLRFQMSRRR